MARSAVSANTLYNMVQLQTRDLYIGGQWVPPTKGLRLDVVSPATEAVIGTIPAADKDDVEKAVAAATAAAKVLLKSSISPSLFSSNCYLWRLCGVSNSGLMDWGREGEG